MTFSTLTLGDPEVGKAFDRLMTEAMRVKDLRRSMNMIANALRPWLEPPEFSAEKMVCTACGEKAVVVCRYTDHGGPPFQWFSCDIDEHRHGPRRSVAVLCEPLRIPLGS